MKTTGLKGERCVIAGLFSAKVDVESRVAAVRAEVSASGGLLVGTVIQRRGVSRSNRPGGAAKMNDPIDARTVLGSGKAEELAKVCKSAGATKVVFVSDIDARQRRILGELVGCEIVSSENTVSSD